MIRIDGSAGGGQVLRSALSLSALTGEAVRVESIRGNRPEPGLKPQHRAAVDLAAACCDAEVEGAELGSDAITFEPGTLAGGEVTVEIPTAGSVSLLFEVAMALAPGMDEPLCVAATGGTDVKWAPPVDAYRFGKLALLARYGWWADLTVERRGFYPAGGGRATLSVAPAEPTPLDLTDRGPLRQVRVHSIASDSLADVEVADRQATAAVDALSAAEYPVDDPAVAYHETRSPGSAVVLVAEYAGGRGVFDALGERGKPAEDVAGDAVAAFEAFHALGSADAREDPAIGGVVPAVDAHLADQLALPLALGGGEMLVPRVTDHIASNRRVLDAFGYEVEIRSVGVGDTTRLSAPVPDDVP